MQFCSENNSNTFDQEQTIHPYTQQTRLFNLKEANSTGNCVGGNPCSQKLDEYINQMNSTTDESKDDLMRKDFPNAYQTAFGSQKENFKPTETRVEGFQNMDDFEDSVQNPTAKFDVNNATPKDFTYNSYADWRAPTFNQWTNVHDDDCSVQNQLIISSKPMKYYVNQFNSPQTDPFIEYTVIGNQKAYGVRNDYERAIPTRLNPLYPTQVTPYPTTPFIGNSAVNRQNVQTSSNLRWGSELRPKRSQEPLTEKDWDRFSPNVLAETVQNAGQFNNIIGGVMQQPTLGLDNGYFSPYSQNNVLEFNQAWEGRIGISSRNLLENLIETSGC